MAAPRISRLWFVLFALAAVVWLAWPWERAHLQAIAILRGLQHKPVPLLCAGVALHDIHVRTVSVPVSGASPLKGYIYEPANLPHPRDIVLLPGVHRLGIDEPRLTTFAAALAQSGFRVLTPEIPSLRQYQVTSQAIPQMSSAIEWLAARDSEQVGVIGFSFAGGLALLAAADPAATPHVAWVWSIGGHASMARVGDYYITGKATGADGSEFALAPHEYGPLVLVYMHPADFLSPSDAAAILPVLQAHLYENPKGEQALAAHLTPSQLSAWKAILAFNSPDEQSRARASLGKHRDEMALVSPEGRVANLHVPVFLLHGAGDNVIPPTESSWLARDLPAGAVRGSLVSRAISHVSLADADPSVLDDWKLVNFFAHVLQFAEAH